jgi:hypothetical protein
MKKTQSATCAVFLAIATGASALAGECAGDFSGDGIIDGADLSELLARWGSCPDSCVHDLDGNGVIDGGDLASLLGAWGVCKTACADDQPFTYVVIPDTQYMTSYSTGQIPEMFYRQTEWIADNVDPLNIRFVSHLGDIVDLGWIDAQWLIADQAMTTLDGQVPYGLTFGNHDADDAVWGRSDIVYNEYFPRERYDSEPWYGDGYPAGKNTNSYQYFEAGCEQYLVMHLQWDPPADVRAWADGVLAANPEQRVIISTHESPGNYVLWNEVLTRHDNVFLIVSGHEGARERYLELTNDFGKVVPSILTDYQWDNPNHGMLRYYTFQPGENTITATTYATWSDFYEVDESSAFTFQVDFGSGVDQCAEEGTSPWDDGPIQLPGRIEAEFYDVGCNQHAYYDIDQFNEGGFFREDAVDIEVAYDEVQGFNVGWLRDGEWINYTVEVNESRDYALDLRVASAGDGSIMRVEVDGVDVTGPITIAPTGSWQSWVTITVPGVPLEAGIREFRLAIDDGDFNLNHIDVN